MLAKSRTAQVILGFLTWGPKSGYDVKKAVGASIGGFWSESFGQIYPALAALAGGGLAVRTDGPRTGRRRQHTYSITDAGRDELRRWLAEPVAMPPPRNELLLKLFFGRAAGRDASIAHVRAFAGEQRALADRYAAIRERMEGQGGGNPNLPYWLATLSHGEHSAHAMIVWAEETLATFEDLSS